MHFSLEQKGSLEGFYNSKGLSIQFRDSAYTWAHQEPRQARREPLVSNSILLPDPPLIPKGFMLNAKNLGGNATKERKVWVPNVTR
jgi:hypothetical protein